MNRLKQLFHQKQNNILSVYFTAGYPELNDTRKILHQLQSQGIDMAEIGIPFSDPMADGPAIQQSSQAALENGMSLKVLFDQLANVRTDITIPLVMMGYLNPIMQYGFEEFCESCRKTGIDALIVPDLPFDDYINEYKAIADRAGIAVIMLITPQTSEERIRLIDNNTDSFIYMVSSASTTGAQNSFDTDKLAYFRRINGMNLRNPRLIGFGISNRATLQAAFDNASGAIVGSQFIKELTDEPGNIDAAVSMLKEKLSR
jgi:tryptophan synthase alpha chain